MLDDTTHEGSVSSGWNQSVTVYMIKGWLGVLSAVCLQGVPRSVAIIKILGRRL
jgi:hypothetical protein